MTELHIYLEPFTGKEEQLEKVFREDFIPAIRIQKGFYKVELLKSRDAMRKYQIQLSFDNEESRMKWVASDEHQKAFPKVSEICQRVSWSGFEVVARQIV